MENLICIDLTKFNNEQILKICSNLNFEQENLLNNKKKGFAKLWLCEKTGTIVAYNTKKDKTIKYTSDFTNKLNSMENFSIKKEERLEPSKPVLNVDTILEKISKFGIQSITKEEKEFLDNQN
jgi:hypothetical protein